MTATQPCSPLGAAPAVPIHLETSQGLPVLWAERPQADRLAIAYRRGQRWALAPLYDALAPIIGSELAHDRARAARLGRPGPLESQDLEQQAWVILARLAATWRPEGGAFGAYVRASLPWELARYTKQQSHARRSVRLRILSVPHELAAEWAAATEGADGRRWADVLGLDELLAALSARERQVLVLVGIWGYRVSEAAGRLGISDTAATGALRRARSAMRAGLAGRPMPPRPLPTGAVATARLLGALLALPAHERLPGRRGCCVAAGISHRQFNTAAADLVAAGAIVGRRGRRAGRLVRPVAERLLQDLEGGERE